MPVAMLSHDISLYLQLHHQNQIILLCISNTAPIQLHVQYVSGTSVSGYGFQVIFEIENPKSKHQLPHFYWFKIHKICVMNNYRFRTTIATITFFSMNSYHMNNFVRQVMSHCQASAAEWMA